MPEAIGDSGVQAVLIHAVYLLNCASEDPEIRERTLASLTQSLRIGAGIGATGVVLHPGSAKGAAVGPAIERAGKLIREALADTESCELHLEDTAGAGGTLGRSFDELAALIEAAGGEPRLGICLDSCHLLASGYEVRTVDGLSDTLEECERTVGLDRLRSLHLNDSMTPLNSNRDRHAAPGAGEFGERGLSVVPLRTAVRRARVRAGDRQRGRGRVGPRPHARADPARTWSRRTDQRRPSGSVLP